MPLGENDPRSDLAGKEDLMKNRIERKSASSNISIETSDSINDKSSCLDISADLKLSFLGGLVKVSGAAEYLDDRVSSEHQERVTLKYACTTGLETLSMNHLGSDNIKYPMVFDQGLATHVVTGITYGAKAFFVFDRKHSDTSSKKKVHGQLHTMVKAIPSVQLEGEGNAKLDLSEAEQKKAASFECAFYGDFVPSINPTTYQEAVRLYKELPTQLGPNNEKAVPITVSLYPLEKLNSNASKLVRQISVQLINRTEKALENLHLFEVKCKDLLKSEVCRSFQSFQNEIEGLIGMNREYKTFQSKLLHILPKIRGGGAEDGELAAVLLDHEKSVL